MGSSPQRLAWKTTVNPPPNTCVIRKGGRTSVEDVKLIHGERRVGLKGHLQAIERLQGIRVNMGSAVERFTEPARHDSMRTCNPHRAVDLDAWRRPTLTADTRPSTTLKPCTSTPERISPPWPQ